MVGPLRDGVIVLGADIVSKQFLSIRSDALFVGEDIYLELVFFTISDEGSSIAKGRAAIVSLVNE